MVRLQTDSAGCSIYFNYGRQHGGERFLDSASLEMTGGLKVETVRCETIRLSDG